jgi:hypothetical protein
MADDAQDPDSLADIGGLQRDGLLLLSYLAETPNRPLISPAVGGAEGVDLQCFIKAPEAIADGVRRLAATPPDRTATRRYAEAFSWDATTAGQLELFRRVVGVTAR